MRKKILAGLILMGLSSSTFVFGEGENKKEAAYEEPYGMAGCGLWTFVIKDKERDPQLGKWALETFILNSQTFGITSGTSNCVAERPNMRAAEQKVFIRANLVSLSREAAQGDGANLLALSEVFGCKNVQDFKDLSRKNYGEIFKDETAEQVLINYHNAIKSDAKTATQCSRVS